MIQRDPRVVQAKKVAKAFVGTLNLTYSDLLITSDNSLVIFTRDTVMYITKLLNINPGFTIAFSYANSKDLEEDEYVPINPDQLFKKYQYYIYSMQSLNLIGEELDIRGRKDIDELLALKSADGAKFYKLRNIHDWNLVYTVPFFAGLTSLNKDDTFGIRLYDLGDGYYLLQYVIFKKKIKREILINLRIFNLI